MRASLRTAGLCALIASQLAWGSACVTEGCQPDNDPRITLGKGVTEYRDMDQGGNRELPLIFGSQGGTHVDLALEGLRLDYERNQEIELIARREGAPVAESYPLARFRCNPETATQQAWGLRLVFWDRPEAPESWTVDIEAKLTDRGGREVRDTAEEVVILGVDF